MIPSLTPLVGRTRYPRNPRVNWASPHAKGLVAFVDCSTGIARELVAGYVVGNTSGALAGAGPDGPAGRWNTAAKGQFQTAATRLRLTLPITIDVWVRWLAAPDTNAHLFGVTYNAAYTTPWIAYYIGTDALASPRQLSAGINSAGSYFGVDSIDGDITVPVDGRAHHLCLRVAAASFTCTFLKDGVRVYHNWTAPSNPTYDSTAQLIVGSFEATKNPQADILCGRVWNRLLSEEEVKTLSDPRHRWDLCSVPERRLWIDLGGAAPVHTPEALMSAPPKVQLRPVAYRG